VIVWISSFPRSGNTFLRIVLNRMFGVRTSTVYEVDGVALRLGADFVGFDERTSTYDAMRDAQDVHFIKTHAPRDRQVCDEDMAICLARDGRDALVSWARQGAERSGRQYESELRLLVNRPGERGAGQWGTNVLSWLQPSVPHRVVLRYDDLVRHPHRTVERAMATLLPDRQPRDDVVIPTFNELHATDRQFFRRGFTGTHRDELPDDLHAAFWAQPENAAAMRLLGWPPDRA
jgi:sulfotransferase family protein